MFGASITRHIREAAKRFLRAREGNVAVIFTIAAIPLISFVGAAIDYSRANTARSSMQAAMDSTALMLSKDLSANKISAADVQTTAQKYFAALYTNKDATVTQLTATYTPNNGNLGNTIALNGSGTVNTDFMRVLGSNFNTLGFGTTATTAWGNVQMRVALVLDNTGSMAQNNKITALRNAVASTGGLIDQLSGLAKNNGDVYISLIPFAKVVNAGASNYGASYIDWTDWLNPPTAQPNNGSTQATLPINWHGIGPGMTCPFTNNNGGFVCNKTPTSTSTTSTIPSSGAYSGYICPSVDYNSHTLYNGCWDSELVPGGSQVFCTGSSCTCPSGAPTSGSNKCSCATSGGVKTCTGPRYVHNWTQPAPIDTTDNINQPHLSPQTGFNVQRSSADIPTTANPYPNPAWNSTACATPTSTNNCTAPLTNNWTTGSTNPISTWTGCITDRTQSYDETGDAPNTGNTATLFPANQYYENSTAYCNSSASTPLEQMMPLTYDWTTLKNNVNAMQPTGGTDQSVGLAWGWQSLLAGQNGPLTVPAEDSNATYNRVIILLSDGLNTEDRWPDNGDGSTQNGTSIDVRQAQQCTNIKNAVDSKGRPMFLIYTIQVNTSTPADPTSTVLQNCASDPSKFFMLTSSSQIATTFTSIGTALSALRVAR
jgi:Flp pilus assembly protein TadG